MHAIIKPKNIQISYFLDNPLAISSIPRLLSGWKFLPINSWRNIVSRFRSNWTSLGNEEKYSFYLINDITSVPRCIFLLLFPDCSSSMHRTGSHSNEFTRKTTKSSTIIFELFTWSWRRRIASKLTKPVQIPT